jgi:hypothetical protein
MYITSIASLVLTAQQACLGFHDGLDDGVQSGALLSARTL